MNVFLFVCCLSIVGEFLGPSHYQSPGYIRKAITPQEALEKTQKYEYKIAKNQAENLIRTIDVTLSTSYHGGEISKKIKIVGNRSLVANLLKDHYKDSWSVKIVFSETFDLDDCIVLNPKTNQETELVFYKGRWWYKQKDRWLYFHNGKWIVLNN